MTGTLCYVSPSAISQQPPRPATRGPLRAAYPRFRHILHELGKFGAVGAAAFLIDTALYTYLLRVHGVETLTAKTASTVVAATIAFIGNRFWTWRHRERSGLAREYTLYFLFNVVGLAIGLTMLGLSHYGMGALWPDVFQTTTADLISANIIGMAFGTLFRFWSYRRFVFPAPRVAAIPRNEPDIAPAVEPTATESS